MKKLIHQTEHKASPLNVDGELWMSVNGKSFGGHDRVALLREIRRCGSISKAALGVGMSYKAAWDAINSMNNLAGQLLVERLTGGKGGGGAKLTCRGEQLIRNFEQLENEHQKFMEHLSSQTSNMLEDFNLVRRISMKTSARNQFLGKVLSIKEGAVNDEVVIEITGGQEMVAIITHGSTTELGLKKDAEVFALIKSSSIILVSGDMNAKFSARNHLSGVIANIQPGAVNTEVVIDLAGGGTVAAIITNESCKTLGLAEKNEVSAIFKASSVILGVPT